MARWACLFRRECEARPLAAPLHHAGIPAGNRVESGRARCHSARITPASTSRKPSRRCSTDWACRTKTWARNLRRRRNYPDFADAAAGAILAGRAERESWSAAPASAWSSRRTDPRHPCRARLERSHGEARPRPQKREYFSRSAAHDAGRRRRGHPARFSVHRVRGRPPRRPPRQDCRPRMQGHLAMTRPPPPTAALCGRPTRRSPAPSATRSGARPPGSS